MNAVTKTHNAALADDVVRTEVNHISADHITAFVVWSTPVLALPAPRHAYTCTMCLDSGIDNSGDPCTCAEGRAYRAEMAYERELYLHRRPRRVYPAYDGGDDEPPQPPAAGPVLGDDDDLPLALAIRAAQEADWEADHRAYLSSLYHVQNAA